MDTDHGLGSSAGQWAWRQESRRSLYGDCERLVRGV